METKIYKNYEDFTRRADKRINIANFLIHLVIIM